ncbi:hypothetical protein IE53DRAFT_122950 [Violaceomyces palustris]|uniref:Uncharacterized protein n=1 Tax=Violaceomyces palustris TaxID=1673888 RepID=A0ACD0NVV5_9BASI|nr:hypothetical protein IE53DRAFT_122950 [Violaceomyces palustris]
MSSYDSSSSEAGPSIPRPKPRFTGWLTMAPTTDAPIASGSANASQNISSTSTTYDPIASTHGGNFVGGSLMYTSTSRSKPKSTKRAKKAASFHLADDADEHDERSSDGDSSSHSSSYSVESEDSPLFDVRASFAPMPRYAPRGAGGPTSKLETASSTFGAGPGAGETAEQAHQGLGPPARNGLQKLNGGGGIEYGGVQFKGKTAHAVEQEMEQLQDVSLMSHAPDAAYLASRLNMLKRNLEVEERMPSYVAYDEDILSEDEMVVMPDLVSTNTTAPVSNASTTSLLDDEEDEVPLDASLDLNVRITDHGSGSSSPSCKPIPIPGSKKRLASVELASSDFTSSCGTTMIDLSRAKAAALDARIEIRQLRRSDLEQVRDLHALHGDNDMVSMGLDRESRSEASLARGPCGTGLVSSELGDEQEEDKGVFCQGVVIPPLLVPPPAPTTSPLMLPTHLPVPPPASPTGLAPAAFAPQIESNG